MKKKYFILLLLILGVYPQLFCQLSGYYTIGGSDADYPNLPIAIEDLYTQGISADVIFALNPGTYPGVVFSLIPGASEENRFILQSVTLDSTDVIIDSTIEFDETSFITIKAISLSTSYVRAIYFFKSREIYLEKCSINSLYDPAAYQDASIYLRHFAYEDTAQSSITIENCYMEGNSPTLFCFGSLGNTLITNCEFNSLGEFALEASAKNINLNNTIFHGGLDITTSGESILKNNTIYGKIDVGHMDSVLNNSFLDNESIRMCSGYYQGNYFAQQFFINAATGSNANAKFIENYFEGPINLAFATNITMIRNTFEDDVSLSFNKILLFQNNLVFGNLHYGDAAASNWNYQVNNNIFSNCYVLARGHHSNISYNNFIDSAYLIIEVQFQDIQVHDNNFCLGIHGAPYPINISHNNYYPLIPCHYDLFSTHYDPMYHENNPGIANNPLLQGKGWSDAPEKDYLGNIRKNPPAIGANEVYICSDSLNNIINVPCGEELYLNLCNLPDTGSFWWSPDTCILNPDTNYTLAFTCNNFTWYLNNSIYGLIDSVSIMVEPFEVKIAEMPLFYCGYPQTLNASYHPSDSYFWSPESGLSNPNIRNPQLLVADTNNLQYVLECEVAGCETSYDTIDINFDPLPVVGMYMPQQNEDTIYFSCFSTCTDEYLWDFGDGSISTEENPYHIYNLNGIYTISLTASNSFGSRSFTFDYTFHWNFEENWAPIGAAWYYEVVYPFSSKLDYIKYESIGYTYVLNKECKIITATEGTTEYGHLIGNSDTAYTYEDNGKIYVYDPSNNDFSQVYDFAADSGTSWITTWDTCNYQRTILGIDSFNANGYTLKTLSHGGLKIFERIGGERTLFHGLGAVNCLPADTVIYEYPFIQQLRCYYDDKIGLYETGVAPKCDYIVGIDANFEKDEIISIYPNPTNSDIFIQLNNINNHKFNIDVFNILGEKVESFITCENTISLSLRNHRSGIYFVSISDGESIHLLKKVILQNGSD